MKKPNVGMFARLTMAAVAVSAIVGCGGGGGNDNTGAAPVPPAVTNPEPPVVTSNALSVQTGQQSFLFYGDVNPQKLGGVKNARIIDPATPNAVLTQSDDVMSAFTGKPVPSTALVGFSSADASYSDLYVNSLYYVKGGNPKVASLKMVHDMATHTDAPPTEKAHSVASGLTAPAYKTFNYLGTKVFLTAKDASGKSVIVFPSADATNTPESFDKKTLLTLQYTAYGQAPNGIVVYDSSDYKIKVMVPSKAGCSACGEDPVAATFTAYTGVTLTSASTYTFLGDIPGTATSALVADGKLHILDKGKLTITEKAVTLKNTTMTLLTLNGGATGHGSAKIAGNGAYYMNSGNVYRVDVATGELTQLTNGQGTSGTVPTGIKTFTQDWVMYGGDGVLMAVKKNADKATPILLAENDKTSGLRSPFDLGVSTDYMYTTYDLNKTTGVTTYKACVFNNASGAKTCKDNSVWPGVISAARKGKLNFEAGYPYTPYAYVRIDGADNFGGGTIKAIDATKPLDDGFAVGKVDTYNFNTFIQATSGYLNQTVDTNGAIVIYGKNDESFAGDAFQLNLLKANSVVKLTNAPAPSVAEITGGPLHCHNRYCAACHAFAGGKIFGDKAGTVETTGYSVKFEFADGSSKLAKLGQGKGENFVLPYKDIKGEFTPVVVTADGATDIKRASKLGHAGLSYANCDYCHRTDDLKYGAPNVITTTK